MHARQTADGLVLPAAVGAVLRDDDVPIDEFMVTVAGYLRAEGVRVGGLVQHALRGHGKCSFEFEDIASGARYPLTQNLGPESRACALDSAALADTSSVVRVAIGDGAQIVIINKFGEQEAGGRGMRQEMMQTVMAGIPLLTSVKRRYLADWLEFVGTQGDLLPVARPAVIDWCRRALSHAPPH